MRAVALGCVWPPTVSPARGSGVCPSQRHCCVPDVDECAAETPPCGDQQYCENVNGSFVCEGAWAPRAAGQAAPPRALPGFHVLLCERFFGSPA